MKYILLTILFLSEITFASIGSISSFKGSVQIERNSQNIRAILSLPIEKNDVITTKDNSNVIIKFNDNTIITVGKNSSLSIEDYLYDTKNSANSRSTFKFLKGTFKSVTGIIGKLNPEKFKLETKTANIGIRGTTVLANQEIVACTSGEISVSTKNKTLNLSQNQYTRISDKTKSPLIINDEILNILYTGLAIDIYKKNEKLILLKDTLEKATEKGKLAGEGNSSSSSEGAGEGN